MISIGDLIDRIRGYINKPRKLCLLIESTAKWNMLCSSMDAIEDTELALEAYLERDFPQSDGEKYLFTYGLLQALFVQQDAMLNLCEALDIECEITSELRAIREIRNDSIGHPSKRNSGGAITYNQISRVTLNKIGFQLMTEYSDNRHASFRQINVIELLDLQRKQLQDIAEEVIGKLDREETQHKLMYKDQKLTEIFPLTLNYYFSKIKQATHAIENRRLGITHLEFIKDCLFTLKNKLEERKILNAYDAIKYLYDEIEYPIAQLELFFKKDSETCLNEKGAYIFVYYLEKRIEELKNMISEIDSEYGELEKHAT